MPPILAPVPLSKSLNPILDWEVRAKADCPGGVGTGTGGNGTTPPAAQSNCCEIRLRCRVDDVAGDGSNLVSYVEAYQVVIDATTGVMTSTSKGNFTDATLSTIYTPTNPKLPSQIGTQVTGSTVHNRIVANGAAFTFPATATGFSLFVQEVAGGAANPTVFPTFIDSDGTATNLAKGQSMENKADGLYKTPPRITTNAGDIVIVIWNQLA